MPIEPELFLPAFVTVLLIMDPLGNVPIFLALTRGYDTAKRRRAALQGSAVAAAVIAAFALFGEAILRVLGIGLPALQAAGGLLLLIVALELFHGTHEPIEAAADGPNVALVPLGTPLLAGPGAIAATMLLTREADGAAGVFTVVLALVAVLAVVYLTLRYADVVARLLKENGIHLLSRVMGLLVAAIAVQLIASAVQEWVTNGVT